MKKDPKFILSASSFYFWKEPYNLLHYVDIIQQKSLNADGMDLYIDTHSGSSLPQFNLTQIKFLQNFPIVALHADFYEFDWRREFPREVFRRKLADINELATSIQATDFVVHADLLAGHPREVLDLILESLPGIRVSLEIMDSTKYFATQPAQLSSLLSLDSRVGFVPDTAHMQDFDFQWEDVFLDPFLSSRISMVHVSNHTSQMNDSWYERNGFEGLSPVHSLCICDKERFPSAYRRELQKYPIVLEGIIPPGDKGVELIDLERAFLSGGTGGNYA